MKLFLLTIIIAINLFCFSAKAIRLSSIDGVPFQGPAGGVVWTIGAMGGVTAAGARITQLVYDAALNAAQAQAQALGQPGAIAHYANALGFHVAVAAAPAAAGLPIMAIAGVSGLVVVAGVAGYYYFYYYLPFQKDYTTPGAYIVCKPKDKPRTVNNLFYLPEAPSEDSINDHLIEIENLQSKCAERLNYLLQSDKVKNETTEFSDVATLDGKLTGSQFELLVAFPHEGKCSYDTYEEKGFGRTPTEIQECISSMRQLNAYVTPDSGL